MHFYIYYCYCYCYCYYFFFLLATASMSAPLVCAAGSLLPNHQGIRRVEGRANHTTLK